MKSLPLIVVLLALGVATSAAAAPADVCRPLLDHCISECPDRRPHEDGRSYGLQAHDYCKVRWIGLLFAHETAGLTHDEFVDGCLRRCVPRSAVGAAPLGLILGGLWTGTLVNAVTAGSGGGRSATPPASP
jgi:hypothetical protein